MIEENTQEWMIKTQNEMRKMLDHSQDLTDVKYVAGADLTVKDDMMVGCFVVCDIDNLDKPVYSKCTMMDVSVPYIPGLLCFREGPVVLSMLNEFQEQHTGINIDLIIVDGCGEWHPRGFGLACYVGLKSGIPTCGVSKTFLYAGNGMHAKDVQQGAQDKCPDKGDYWLIEHTLEDGFHIKCGVMRTTDSMPFNPIYISCGHLCSLESVANVIKRICKFREPEPVRLADRISRQFIRESKNESK